MSIRKAPEGAGSRPVRRARRRRARPRPKWLEHAQEWDQLAKARCLLILDVLSGHTPVTDAIQAAKISRGTYYQFETRALEAMLRALTPGAEPGPGVPDRLAAARRIASLESQVRRLEQAKRRAERLVVLTRKVVQPGRLTLSRRPRASTKAGAAASPRRPPTATTSRPPASPMPAGAGGP